jgi:hypothetical protein
VPPSVSTTCRSLGTNDPTSATVACNANAILDPLGENASSAGVRTSSRSSAVGAWRRSGTGSIGRIFAAEARERERVPISSAAGDRLGSMSIRRIALYAVAAASVLVATIVLVTDLGPPRSVS